MTLVEVVASLALLGSLLGAAVLAKGRLMRQWSVAQDRVEAVELLSAQLALWHGSQGQDGTEQSEGSAWPHSGEGPLGQDGQWWWRAEALEVETSQVAGLSVVRFTAFDPTQALTRDESPLATMDVLIYESLTESTDPASVSSNEQTRGVRP